MQNNMCACVRCAAMHHKLRYLYYMLLAPVIMLYITLFM